MAGTPQVERRGKNFVSISMTVPMRLFPQPHPPTPTHTHTHLLEALRHVVLVDSGQAVDDREDVLLLQLVEACAVGLWVEVLEGLDCAEQRRQDLRDGQGSPIFTSPGPSSSSGAIRGPPVPTQNWWCLRQSRNVLNATGGGSPWVSGEAPSQRAPFTPDSTATSCGT